MNGDAARSGRTFRVGDQECYIAPASESKARAGALLPTAPSEDASSVLGRIPLDLREVVPYEREEYLPDDVAEWIVTAAFPAQPCLLPKVVSDTFDKQWREAFGGFTAYGRDADNGRWTFLISADGPKAVTDLKFAWDFCGSDERERTATADIFNRRVVELRRKLATFGACQLHASLEPIDAATRATALAELKRQLASYATLVLAAPAGQSYDGRLLWDVMLSLGLEWGDMDCFHWPNRTDVGHDQFFSVETTTPPGYFFPEQLASGEMRPADLVFVFSIPRCPAPLPVFDAMWRAVEYCRSRLGGEVRDEDGAPARIAAMRAKIEETDRRLRGAGLVPGSHPALRLF